MFNKKKPVNLEPDCCDFNKMFNIPSVTPDFSGTDVIRDPLGRPPSSVKSQAYIDKTREYRTLHPRFRKRMVDFIRNLHVIAASCIMTLFVIYGFITDPDSSSTGLIQITGTGLLGYFFLVLLGEVFFKKEADIEDLIYVMKADAFILTILTGFVLSVATNVIYMLILIVVFALVGGLIIISTLSLADAWDNKDPYVVHKPILTRKERIKRNLR